MRILLIDNDIESLDKLRAGITDHYIVDVAHDTEEGTYLSQINEYSAIVVDSSDFCRQTRTYDEETPILMLVESENVEEKLDSFACGADAVLTKPIHACELQAYLQVLINRAHKTGVKDVFCVEDLNLSLSSRRVIRGGKEIPLRKKEFEILKCLVLNKGRVVTKEQILESVWEVGFEVNSNTLEVHMKTLRDKIDREFEPKLIKTIYGLGYRLSG